MITLALSKGRIFDETRPLLAAAGIAPLEDPETSRKLIIGTTNPELRIVVVRASDVPTYVQYGAADFGVAGKDVLMEHGGAGLYQPVDLNIARCRLCVAVPAGFDYASAVRRGARLRVATKYVRSTRRFFTEEGVGHYRIVESAGATEGAPAAGVADLVVDITTTGATLYDSARLPEAVHLWRAQVGWMGGLVILVAAAAILAPVNLGGAEVVTGRVPGQRDDGPYWFIGTMDPAARVRRHAAQVVARAMVARYNAAALGDQAAPMRPEPAMVALQGRGHALDRIAAAMAG